MISGTGTYWVCSWWTCNETPFWAKSTKLGESYFQIWVSFFECNKQFMEIAQNWPLLFVNTFLYACIILFLGKLSAVFIILIESINKINCIIALTIALPFFLESLWKYSFLCFSSLADRIEYSETPKYSEQSAILS